MPVVEIHLVEGDHTPERLETLLRRISECHAAELGWPLARTRAFVTMHRPQHWMTGGVTAAVDGDPAPYLVAAVPEALAAAARRRLLGDLTDVVCEVLGSTRSRVRIRLEPVAAQDWAVGGVTAAARPPEVVVARSSRL